MITLCGWVLPIVLRSDEAARRAVSARGTDVIECIETKDDNAFEVFPAGDSARGATDERCVVSGIRRARCSFFSCVPTLGQLKYFLRPF